LFSATGFPLVTYLFFAYKVIGNQGQYLLPQLPGWATSDRFDIQARAEGNPGKDQMRMMMRSLLADRFKAGGNTPRLAKYRVLAFVLAKPGKDAARSSSRTPPTRLPDQRSASAGPRYGEYTGARH